MSKRLLVDNFTHAFISAVVLKYSVTTARISGRGIAVSVFGPELFVPWHEHSKERLSKREQRLSRPEPA
jgi:hypothetical protein